MAVTTTCGLPIDNVTLEMDYTKTPPELKVKSGVESMPIATTTVLGGVIPDGTIITVSETGAITVPDATASVKGVVKQAVVQADSTATTVEGLVTDFNALLAKLKIAGVMANA